jgi:hypothetical protein
MSYLHDLRNFLVAIVTNFSNQLTGGVIVAAVTLYYGLIKKVSPPPKVYKVLVVVFGILACFNVWQAEYLKTNPRFQLHLDQFGFAEVPFSGSSKHYPPRALSERLIPLTSLLLHNHLETECI